MPRKIFYSWQSWLPHASNRGLIHEALEAACDECTANLSEAQRPELDHDTRGVPGAPDIVQTIFAKIDSCDAFVADVSLVHCDPEKRRFTPNPNVMVELGYAIKTLGWDRILLVINAHFGAPEVLPFDLKTRLTVTYNVDPVGTAAKVAAERTRLQADLQKRIAEILGRTAPRTNHSAEVVKNLQLVKSEAAQMVSHAEEVNQTIFAKPSTRPRLAEWADQVLRLLRRRFHPEVIDGALVHIAGELEAHQMLRDQLGALRRTAYAADREAAQLVAQLDRAAQWGDLAPFHRQVQELMTTARLVMQEVNGRLTAIEKAAGA